MEKQRQKQFTSISIKREDYKKLSDYKIHPNQPMWEIIKSILNKEVLKNVNRNDKPSVQD